MAIAHDMRYAVRVLAKSPGFTATALLVLALGIGLNAAVFTITNALLLKPVGGDRPGELAGLFSSDRTRPGRYDGFSYADYQTIRDSGIAFSSVLAQTMQMVGVSENGATRRTFAALVSSTYFSTLGVRPVLGREFVASEEERTDWPVVIVSHAYWRIHGRDAAIIGRNVRINGHDFTVAGVMPADFSGTTAIFSPEFWLPVGAIDIVSTGGGAPGRPADPIARDLQVAGRLKGALTVTTMAPSCRDLAARLRQASPQANRDLQVTASRLSRLSPSSGPQVDRDVAAVMTFLLALAVMVLLVATVNLANMLLAKGAAREREIGIRLALGAGRGQVLRQLLTESMLLSVAGAALGLTLATVAVRVLAARVAPELPFVLAFDPWPDHRVILATGLFALLTTLAFGVGPSLRLVRTDVMRQLKHQAGQRPGGRLRLRNLLVASQLALSLALLAGGGLFVRGAWQATGADPGFSLENGLVATVDPSLAGHGAVRARETYRQVMTRVRSMAGVESASLASAVPFSPAGETRAVRRADQGARGSVEWPAFTVTGGDYFKTLHLPMLRGREFTASEEGGTSAPGVAIVDETLAHQLWPGGHAIGQSIQVSDDTSTWEQPLEVIGVARAVRQGLFDTRPTPHVYVPFAALYRPEMTIHVRVRPAAPGAMAAMMQSLGRELRIVDPQLAVLSVRTLTQHRDASVYMWIARAGAGLFTTFGVSALALAMLGVYGLKAFLVSRRTREIGIRMALGATRADVMWLVVADSAKLAGAGISAGFVLAVLLSRVLASWVYGLAGFDALVPCGAALLLVACSFLACYLPVRRATAIAPIAALRSE
jgi:macrolide transport system ATP-binding/permease protein